MPIDTTYTSLRENLAAVLDRVIDDQEVVIVRRRGAKDVALIPADELNSLLETAHLLHSPRNARRLKESIQEARQGKGRRMSLKKLREAVGLDAED
jgi:antitoxin YefM